MIPQNLKTKREYDVYIQALQDVKKSFDRELKIQIDFFKDSKKFCDKE